MNRHNSFHQLRLQGYALRIGSVCEKAGGAKNLTNPPLEKNMKTAKRLLFACVLVAASTLPLLAEGPGPAVPIPGSKGGHLIQVAR